MITRRVRFQFLQAKLVLRANSFLIMQYFYITVTLAHQLYGDCVVIVPFDKGK